MKKSLLLLASLLGVASAVNAQYVDVTTIDVQTETNKRVVIEKPLDPTLRPKGFIGAIGAGLEFALDYGGSAPGFYAQLGYQLSSRVALTGEYFFSGLYTGFEYRMGGKLNALYYFSPKLAKGWYGIASLGLEDFELEYDYSDYIWSDTPLFLELGGGYAWKYYKIEGTIGVHSMEEKERESHWSSTGTWYSTDYSHYTECLLSIKATAYFNSGYRKMKK